MTAFTCIQITQTNRAIAPEFVLIVPNLSGVNTPLKLNLTLGAIMSTVMKDKLRSHSCVSKKKKKERLISDQTGSMGLLGKCNESPKVS